LSSSQPNDLRRLSKYDWCLPQKGVPLRDKWEQMFLAAGLPIPNIRVECGSVITIRQILMQTNCLTVLSPDQVAVELEAKWVKIVGTASNDMRRIIGLTYRDNWRPTSAQSEMMAYLRQVS